MPRTRECDYCGGDIEPGTGTMFVRTNGSIVHYCSAKCEKNADLGREARDLEWTAAGRGQAGEQESTDEQTSQSSDAETVEEVDEREDAGTEPDVETAEADGAEDEAASEEEAAAESGNDETEDSEAGDAEGDEPADSEATESDGEETGDDRDEETEEAQA